jgi:hypothetical protein
MTQHLFRGWPESFAGRRQPDLMLTTLEQAGADPGFQRPNAPAEGGLRHGAALGRSGKAAFIKNGEEILEPDSLHNISPIQICGAGGAERATIFIDGPGYRKDGASWTEAWQAATQEERTNARSPREFGPPVWVLVV